jgi:hypothetical protein
LPTANQLELLAFSFIIILGSIIMGILQMQAIAHEVTDPENIRRLESWQPLGMLGMRLVIFSAYLFVNLPHALEICPILQRK